MARLVGEIDLAPVPLTMNKSDFARDGPEWIAVEKRMHALLTPIARRLAEDELAPPPASALKTSCWRSSFELGAATLDPAR
jgi:hypothetical protein